MSEERIYKKKIEAWQVKYKKMPHPFSDCVNYCIKESKKKKNIEQVVI